MADDAEGTGQVQQSALVWIGFTFKVSIVACTICTWKQDPLQASCQVFKIAEFQWP